LQHIVDYGIADGTQYPYTAQKGNCMNSTYPSVFHVPNTGHKYLGGNEELMKSLLYKFGPIVITFSKFIQDNVKIRFLIITLKIADVIADVMQYRSGVYYSTVCTTEANHAVVLVGYGTDPDYGDYWKIRNSWGELQFWACNNVY
jgi:Papain family cysteine protease